MHTETERHTDALIFRFFASVNHFFRHPKQKSVSKSFQFYFTHSHSQIVVMKHVMLHAVHKKEA